jgi:hypothetical protein
VEHNPLECGCTYLGCDSWSCGHIDNAPTEEEAPICDHCGQRWTWNPAVDAFEHADPCNTPNPSTE